VVEMAKEYKEYVNCWLRRSLRYLKLYDGRDKFYAPTGLHYWLLPSAPLREAALQFLRLWCDENVTEDVASVVASEIEAIAELFSDDDYTVFLDYYINKYSDPFGYPDP
jgi:hypothetical protein